jgi:hypothetical protein
MNVRPLKLPVPGYVDLDDAPASPDSQWPKPDMRLVEDDRMPAPMLSEDALPAGWEKWIADEAASRGCPRDYSAVGLIVSASAWIGNARHVAVNETWSEPPHLWMALIGAPSTGKTPALRPIVEACRAIERDSESAWQAEMMDHAALAEGARAIDEEWRTAVRKAVKQCETAPSRPPGADAPLEPPRPRVLVMDSTTEELQRLLAGQPRGLLHLRDELTGWFGNLDRYGGQGGDRAFFLETWNGGSYAADRVKHRGQPLRIARATLAMLGGMQPDRLREALAGADDGLAARFGYVWPDPLPILPLPSEPDAAARGRRERLTRAAQRLYALPMDGALAASPRRAYCRSITMRSSYSTNCAKRLSGARDRGADWRPAGTARLRAGRFAWRSSSNCWLGPLATARRCAQSAQMQWREPGAISTISRRCSTG